MRRIIITLTDEEYGDLERRALQDRRSVRDMAARLVTAPSQPQYTPLIPYVAPSTPSVPWFNPIISTGRTSGLTRIPPTAGIPVRDSITAQSAPA